MMESGVQDPDLELDSDSDLADKCFNLLYKCTVLITARTEGIVRTSKGESNLSVRVRSKPRNEVLNSAIGQSWEGRGDND